jgi:hypothetical protein
MAVDIKEEPRWRGSRFHIEIPTDKNLYINSGCFIAAKIIKKWLNVRG